MKRILTLIACLFVASTAAAPAPTSYDIEVVVFENRLPQLEGNELWLQDVSATAPDLATAVDITDAVPTDSSLTNAVSALQRDGSYKVLVHQRWRQSAEEKSAAKAVRLRNPDGQLEGVLRFYMSRFLHVDVDLLLRDQTAVVNQSAVMGLNYRLTEHRRVKTQEMNYFDHPKLGMLLRITAVGKE